MPQKNFWRRVLIDVKSKKSAQQKMSFFRQASPAPLIPLTSPLPQFLNMNMYGYESMSEQLKSIRTPSNRNSFECSESNIHRYCGINSNIPIYIHSTNAVVYLITSHEWVREWVSGCGCGSLRRKLSRTALAFWRRRNSLSLFACAHMPNATIEKEPHIAII